MSHRVDRASIARVHAGAWIEHTRRTRRPVCVPALADFLCRAGGGISGRWRDTVPADLDEAADADTVAVFATTLRIAGDVGARIGVLDAVRGPLRLVARITVTGPGRSVTRAVPPAGDTRTGVHRLTGVVARRGVHTEARIDEPESVGAVARARAVLGASVDHGRPDERPVRSPIALRAVRADHLDTGLAARGAHGRRDQECDADSGDGTDNGVRSFSHGVRRYQTVTALDMGLWRGGGPMTHAESVRRRRSTGRAPMSHF